MAFIKRHLALLVSLVCFAGTAKAEVPERVVDIKFCVYSNDRLSGLFYNKSSGRPGVIDPVELIANSHSRGPVVRYRGPATINLFTMSKAADGTTVPKPACQVTIPAEMKEALLVVIMAKDPTAEGGWRFQGFVYDDSVAAFPVGSVRILNLTSASFEGVAGTETISVPGGPTMTTPVARIGNSRVGLALRAQDTFVAVVNQGYEVTPEQRLLMVLLPPYRTNSVDVRARILKDEPHGEQLDGALAKL